jgi:hypothetical protein
MKNLILAALILATSAAQADCNVTRYVQGVYRYHTQTSVGQITFDPVSLTYVKVDRTAKRKTTTRGLYWVELGCMLILTVGPDNNMFTIGLTEVDSITKTAYSGEFIGGSMTKVYR